MRMTIGITGGIASGKSNIVSELKKFGYNIIDADAIARELQKIDGPLYNKIVEEFGSSYLLEDNNLDRKKLANLIYIDKNARQRLNNISHPLIIDEIKDRIKQSDGIIFLDVPLLYETGLDSLCDYVICVYVAYDLELERLCQRDQIDYDYAKRKIQSQMNLEEKRNRADFVIDSSGSFEETRNNLNKILKRIEEKKNGTN